MGNSERMVWRNKEFTSSAPGSPAIAELPETLSTPQKPRVVLGSRIRVHKHSPAIAESPKTLAAPRKPRVVFGSRIWLLPESQG